MGISGRKGDDGKILDRKGGLRGRFLSGKQFGDRRSRTRLAKMKEEAIEALHIYWWVTYDGAVKDFPRDIESVLLKKFFSIKNSLPRWNNKF